MKNLSAINENEDIVTKKYVDDKVKQLETNIEQDTLIQKKYPYYYGNNFVSWEFYGVESIDNIVVDIGQEVDVIYATLVLLTQTVSQLKTDYSQTLSAIQGIYIDPDINPFESNVMTLKIEGKGIMNCYIDSETNYITQADLINFRDGYSVNYGSNPNALTVYYDAKEMVGSENISKIVTCTTAEYNLSSKSSDTMYVITD